MRSSAHVVLLVIGILALIKAAWALVHPESIRRVGNWGLTALKSVNTLAGVFYALLGAVIWALVLSHQPVAHWILTIFGFLLIVCAYGLLRYDQFEPLFRRMVLPKRVLATRITGAILLIFAALSIWVAWTDPIL